jgi:hypothetical protein
MNCCIQDLEVRNSQEPTKRPFYLMILYGIQPLEPWCTKLGGWKLEEQHRAGLISRRNERPVVGRSVSKRTFSRLPHTRLDIRNVL